MTKWFTVSAIRVSGTAVAAIICAAGLLIITAMAAQQNQARMALWDIVHTACVPAEKQTHDPAPCTAVDLSGGEDKGFAILKDLRGATQFLLIPTTRISGIESPELLAPKVPNYFADAWEARSYVNAALHKTLPREDIVLAVNSIASRSQDQLHIHVDCVRSDMGAELRLHLAEIGNSWAPLRFALLGHHYTAMWVPGEKLGANDPFKLLAQGVPGAVQNMGERTLVVIGGTRADGTPGFLLLEGQVNKLNGDMAHGEELQDHACPVAATVPAR